MSEVNAKAGQVNATGKVDSQINTYDVVMLGDIDVFSFQALRQFFNEWKENVEAANLMVDLSQVTYMGSSGWALLFSQNHVAKHRKGMVVCHGLNDRLQRSLGLITGNRNMLKTAPNREEAVAMIRDQEKRQVA